MTHEERRALGAAGREHTVKNYGFENYKETWVNEMLDVHEKLGSWDNRKDYQGWEIKTL